MKPSIDPIVARHSFTSRLLFTVMPSELYYKKQTLDMLHGAMVNDLQSLYSDGITVALPISSVLVFVQYIRNYIYELVCLFMCLPSAEVCKVQWSTRTFTFHMVPIMLKGDWPYLRAAAHLATGFSSKRKCHLCNARVAGLIQFVPDRSFA